MKQDDVERGAKVDPIQFGDESKFIAVKTFLQSRKSSGRKSVSSSWCWATLPTWRSYRNDWYMVVWCCPVFACHFLLYIATMRPLWYNSDEGCLRMERDQSGKETQAYQPSIGRSTPLENAFTKTIRSLSFYGAALEWQLLRCLKSNRSRFVEHHKKLEDAIRKQTVELRNIQKATIDKISGSISVILTAIFEATDVQTPTCFVIGGLSMLPPVRYYLN